MAGSAQWTSSTMTRTGATADRRRSRPTRASNRRAWSHACWTGAAGDAGSSAGTSRARSGPDVPTTASEAVGLRAADELAEDLDDRAPYGPIVEILGQLVRELDPDRLEVVVGASGADLARLVPALDPGVVGGAAPAGLAPGPPVRRPRRRAAAAGRGRARPRADRGRPLVGPRHARDPGLPRPDAALGTGPRGDDAALGRAPPSSPGAAVAG